MPVSFGVPLIYLLQANGLKISPTQAVKQGCPAVIRVGRKRKWWAKTMDFERWLRNRRPESEPPPKNVSPRASKVAKSREKPRDVRGKLADLLGESAIRGEWG